MGFDLYFMLVFSNVTKPSKDMNESILTFKYLFLQKLLC